MPLVEALYTQGIGIGAAMVFMVSVVARSVPSLTLLERVMTLRLRAVFTRTVMLEIMIIGDRIDATD